MVQTQWGRRLVPIALGAGMLGTVVAAGLAPTIGAVAAQSNCQYGACPAGSSTPFPWWIVGVVLVVVILASILGVLLFRRRPPTSPPAEDGEPPSGASGSGPAPPSPPSAAPFVAGAVAGGVAAPVANYVETPDDVGATPPAVAGGAAVAGAAAQEPDIDSLMAELDKISGEILKKAPKPGSGGSAASEAAEDTTR
ncbi:MAG: hypothetical protein L3J92_01835 [Thermoplasmata archaeon]|jgi:hypothetical protein|nr:hypothetical protein [Thermoplasmata archaeon]